MYRLRNGTMNYAWGSTDAIPAFVGAAGDGQPLAEMWMGTHPLSPSTAIDAAGRETSLTDVAGDLPFLLKLLAADQPLSLQVHPNKAFAEEGFASEELSGLALDHPHRVYKDPNHKPEMAYALTTFDTLIGFRPTAEILRVLAPIDTRLSRMLVDELHHDPGFRGIVRLVETMLMSDIPASEVHDVISACGVLAEAGLDIKRAYATVGEIAAYYPDDIGVVISLLLNRMTLQPGEAAYLEPGVIHAHLKGMCLEVMATSDNVLRAGLTTKHVDPKGLVRCLDYGMSRVARVTPTYMRFGAELYAPTSAFALAVTQVSSADPDGLPLPQVGRCVLICTGGNAVVWQESGESVQLARGESVYVTAADGRIMVRGVGEIAQVFEPTSAGVQSELIDLV